MASRVCIKLRRDQMASSVVIELVRSLQDKERSCARPSAGFDSPRGTRGMLGEVECSNWCGLTTEWITLRGAVELAAAYQACRNCCAPGAQVSERGADG